MQSNIYGEQQKVSTLLTKKELGELDSFLSYQNDSYITCNELANRLNIEYELAKKVINELIKMHIVQMCFKVYCNNFDMSNEEIYSNIEDIPNEECDGCEKGCSVLKNIIVIYKINYQKEW